jgi:hypothetical protein
MSKYSLDRFLEACGAAAPLRLTVVHGGGANEHVLPQPFVLAGTDPRADICPADPRVPRRAAYLQVLAGRLLCMDLTAAAGDRKDRNPPRHWLDPGQTWQCGSMAVRLAADGSDGAANAVAVRPENLRPMSVEIAGGSSGVCQYALRSPLVLIGKSPQCQVRLRDKAVSRFHCALVQTGSGLWAVDLLGRGGVSVNGATARAACLDDGDELRIGGFSFRPRQGPPQTPASRAENAGALQIAAPPLVEALAMPAFVAGNSGGDLAPIVSLFSTLQQQMADHFRLTMTGMMESFWRMHADQMRVVWEELAQIRRLNDEVASLKETLARQPAVPAAIRAPEARRPAALPNDNRPWDARPGDLPAATPAAKTSAGPAHPLIKNGEPIGRMPPTSAPGEDDVHSWVSRRIAEVQRDREGRWQRIVSFLTGAPS